jgi:hypothetical protein
MEKKPFEERSFFPSSTCHGVTRRVKTELHPFFPNLLLAFSLFFKKEKYPSSLKKIFSILFPMSSENKQKSGRANPPARFGEQTE